MRELAVGVCAGICATTAGWAQVPNAEVAAEAFRSGTAQQKIASLVTAARDLDPVASERWVTLLQLGVSDEDARVRQAGINSIAARLGAVRFPPAPDVVARRERDRVHDPVVRHVAETALSDADERIRRDAIVALVQMDVSAGREVNDIDLAERTASLLEQMYDQETSGLVQAEIVKTFALVRKPLPDEGELYAKALTSSSSDVVQFAVVGAAKVRDVTSLTRIAELLRHEERAVRISAATSILRFGREANTLAPQVRAALAAETDLPIKKTLEQVLASIQ